MWTVGRDAELKRSVFFRVRFVIDTRALLGRGKKTRPLFGVESLPGTALYNLQPNYIVFPAFDQRMYFILMMYTLCELEISGTVFTIAGHT